MKSGLEKENRKCNGKKERGDEVVLEGEKRSENFESTL